MPETFKQTPPPAADDAVLRCTDLERELRETAIRLRHVPIFFTVRDACAPHFTWLKLSVGGKAESSLVHRNKATLLCRYPEQLKMVLDKRGLIFKHGASGLKAA